MIFWYVTVFCEAAETAVLWGLSAYLNSQSLARKFLPLLLTCVYLSVIPHNQGSWHFHPDAAARSIWLGICWGNFYWGNSTEATHHITPGSPRKLFYWLHIYHRYELLLILHECCSMHVHLLDFNNITVLWLYSLTHQLVLLWYTTDKLLKWFNLAIVQFISRLSFMTLYSCIDPDEKIPFFQLWLQCRL